ncbi:MAG: hypothetical protein FJ270_09975 [Planctomycetes bacterium]|nr:hypothetical protein [Planctomycetota bacterium]
MATYRKHGVFLELDLREYRVRAKDVVFFVYRGRGAKKVKFGELRVSQGAVVWRSRADQIGRKLGWTKLSRIFEEHGFLQEVRKPNARKSVSPRARG